MSLAKINAHVLNNKLAHLDSIGKHVNHEYSWAVSLILHDKFVLDGFFLYSLLLDKSERSERLILSHDLPSQRDRLQEALAERNKRTEGVGQEEYTHACDLCFVVMKDDFGREGKLMSLKCFSF